jgi:endonuclease-3
VQVNKTTDKLFKIIKKPADVLAMWFDVFESSIKSINYYRSKAKHIFATTELLQENIEKSTKSDRNFGIPDTLEGLMKLPWVWIKTAKLVAHVLYDQPFIAVDTHIHRVSNRLWLVKTITPEKTSELLEKTISNQYKDHAHHALVLFGRYYCKAQKPMCEDCKLQKICLYYKQHRIVRQKI